MKKFTQFMKAIVRNDGPAALSVMAVEPLLHSGGIYSLLSQLDTAGFSRRSRKGWSTIEHSEVGLLQWKLGPWMGSALPFLFLRINGKLILSWRPREGTSDSYPEFGGRKTTDVYTRRVLHILGGINTSEWNHEAVDEAFSWASSQERAYGLQEAKAE